MGSAIETAQEKIFFVLYLQLFVSLSFKIKTEKLNT
jgi:hypothetical protein